MSDQSPILIVEDEAAHAEALAEALDQEGYAVTVASNGEEGLEIVITITFSFRSTLGE